ncbi:type II secretion system major pseudopilin GspG [Maricaulis sp. W15]|uniref:type II secretion system major pseudopilin GspG n=1 Tax=Maricaulis sp. W15 TaxID=1772333 RepID=UPI0009FA88F0|nr:type II secretion system major pseudopilin GspG [Maricaulis sp. W15]
MMLFSKSKVECRRPPKEAGITLFELLVVLVIIALLATIVAPRVIGYAGRSKVNVATAQLASIQTSLELYYLDLGEYPTEDEGLVALVEPPEDATGWQGPYMRNVSGLTDPWGVRYSYTLDETGERFTIGSLGRDGEPGGEGEDRDLFRS